MDGPVTDKYLLDWDEVDVHQWLSKLGFPHYERQIREHKIQGDTLCLLDSEALKSMGVASVGQRLSILKSVFNLKVAHNIPFNEDDYIPPSEATENISLEDIHSTVKDQAQRLRTLEEIPEQSTMLCDHFWTRSPNFACQWDYLLMKDSKANPISPERHRGHWPSRVGFYRSRRPSGEPNSGTSLRKSGRCICNTSIRKPRYLGQHESEPR
ncbi:hypothetical protein BDZ97DRAFT_505211 [Flammula alnicola]|nr:hypothetical protein BDZ97DRAFT_505211 [Flammula alnicola]